MRRGPVCLLALAALSGCSYEMPSFLGREGDQSGTYTLGGDAAEAPDPVEMPVTSAVAERGLHGVILRAESVAPTQGYYGALLAPVDPESRADANGIVTVKFTALPPATPGATGPARTRMLDAALFVQNVTLRGVKAFRVVGSPNSITVPVPK
ncbi:hypothetical protein [Amaricoccus solimangrovi]|uniref:Lipoprotein n=1 Tax=Amaricoccus solimangrovi TaxID=2589815 RepID=A0A501WSN9_9RHOB|nr:hypothetical protein [Amaricoccus solimangrovi]TPE51370.1 hypothetical protein FJM51_09010 [Amaricoccus solimangrovi]